VTKIYAITFIALIQFLHMSYGSATEYGCPESLKKQSMWTLAPDVKRVSVFSAPEISNDIVKRFSQDVSTNVSSTSEDEINFYPFDIKEMIAFERAGNTFLFVKICIEEAGGAKVGYIESKYVRSLAQPSEARKTPPALKQLSTEDYRKIKFKGELRRLNYKISGIVKNCAPIFKRTLRPYSF
jgi:hypothetical protein